MSQKYKYVIYHCTNRNYMNLNYDNNCALTVRVLHRLHSLCNETIQVLYIAGSILDGSVVC